MDRWQSSRRRAGDTSTRGRATFRLDPSVVQPERVRGSRRLPRSNSGQNRNPSKNQLARTDRTVSNYFNSFVPHDQQGGPQGVAGSGTFQAGDFVVEEPMTDAQLRHIPEGAVADVRGIGFTLTKKTPYS